MKPLSDKQRAIILTNLGITHAKGLSEWRKRLNITPPPSKAKPPKPSRPPGVANASKPVRCVETGQIFNSIALAAAHFGSRPNYLTKHLRGMRPNFCGYTFQYF